MAENLERWECAEPALGSARPNSRIIPKRGFRRSRRCQESPARGSLRHPRGSAIVGRRKRAERPPGDAVAITCRTTPPYQNPLPVAAVSVSRPASRRGGTTASGSRYPHGFNREFRSLQVPPRACLPARRPTRGGNSGGGRRNEGGELSRELSTANPRRRPGRAHFCGKVRPFVHRNAWRHAPLVAGGSLPAPASCPPSSTVARPAFCTGQPARGDA